jgi:hypothetical protein
MISKFKISPATVQKAFAGTVALLLAGAAWSDDVTGEDELLCASMNVIVCLEDGSCVSATPWELDVPQFINIDLDKRSLSTTEASGESRTTKVESVTRSNGVIFLQGVDRGRAYSFVIDEETGFLTVAIAREFLTMTVFGACTPTP